MSREFGEYHSGGYFHQKIQGAADDAQGGRDALTRMWGAFLQEFYEVAHAVSTSEACDSGAYHPILETIAHLPALKDRLREIEGYIQPFKDVAEEAVRTLSDKKGTP